MGWLLKSKDERRIDREMKIRQGIRRIERAIREQEKFTDEFITNAQRARQIGDNAQYAFIRNSLKKTIAIRKVLERQLLSVKNALLSKRQAEATSDFTISMSLMAKEIGRLFGEHDLTKTQNEWERAMIQSQTMEERMSLFLDGIQDVASQDQEMSADPVPDEEVDALLDAESVAAQVSAEDELSDLRSELDALKGNAETTSNK